MTVYVIDDHPLMRDALTMLVQRVRPGLKVVSVAKLNSLESTVERQGPPELFCLDLKLPDTLGLSGVHAVKAKFPDVPLVVVTGSEASECEAACLEAGANDFGSIMLEENVVSAAGAPHRFTYKSIQEAIREAGFEPQLRNQHYEWRELPQDIQEQVIDY